MRKRKTTYPAAKTANRPAPATGMPGAAPDHVRSTVATINLQAAAGRSDVVVGSRVRILGTGRYAGDIVVIEKLVGGPIKLPFLPTFFGLIGGVKTMGFVGLFIGPVLMALLVSMWREWMLDLDEPEATAVLVELETDKEAVAQPVAD